MCCSTQIRLSLAIGVGIGGVSSYADDCAAAAGWYDSNPGTSGSSDSRRVSPDAALDPAPPGLEEAAAPVTETCVEPARSLSKWEASDSGTEGACVLLLSLLPLRLLTHVAVDPSFELRAVDPTFELRAVELERVVREALCALCHAAILLGR